MRSITSCCHVWSLAQVLSNGSVMLGYRAGGDTMAAGDAGIGMAFAPSWNSSFERRAGYDGMLFGALLATY